jgi:hypothetical protein
LGFDHCSNKLFIGTISLTDRSFQRHRIASVQEMSEDELKPTGGEVSSSTGSMVAEFKIPPDLKEWLGKNAPAFLA